jgi:hypothetical protein
VAIGTYKSEQVLEDLLEGHQSEIQSQLEENYPCRGLEVWEAATDGQSEGASEPSGQ